LKLAALFGVISPRAGARLGPCVAAPAAKARERTAEVDGAGRMLRTLAHARRVSIVVGVVLWIAIGSVKLKPG
jgi:hypothetical protein